MDDRPVPDPRDLELVPIFFGAGIETDIVRALLEDRDIPVAKFGSASFVEGEGLDRVMVRRMDLDRANAVIDEAMSDGIVGEIVAGAELDEDGSDVETGWDVTGLDEDEDEDLGEARDEQGWGYDEPGEEPPDVEILAAPRAGKPVLLAIAVLVTAVGAGLVVLLSQSAN